MRAARIVFRDMKKGVHIVFAKESQVYKHAMDKFIPEFYRQTLTNDRYGDRSLKWPNFADRRWSANQGSQSYAIINTSIDASLDALFCGVLRPSRALLIPDV
jgi:hypothetical protein